MLVDWASCEQCGAHDVSEVRDHASCPACNKNYRRSTRTTPWPICKSCGSGLHATKQSASCACCGVRRDGAGPATTPATSLSPRDPTLTAPSTPLTVTSDAAAKVALQLVEPAKGKG